MKKLFIIEYIVKTTRKCYQRQNCYKKNSETQYKKGNVTIVRFNENKTNSIN